MVILLKQGQMVLISLLGVEGCQPAEICRQMYAMYGAACMLKVMVVN